LTDFILLLHQYNFYLIVAAAAISGIWGLVLYFTRRPLIKSWRIMLIITLALGILQGLFGLIMVFSGLKPGEAIAISGLSKLHEGVKVRVREALTTNQANGLTVKEWRGPKSE